MIALKFFLPASIFKLIEHPKCSCIFLKQKIQDSKMTSDALVAVVVDVVAVVVVIIVAVVVVASEAAFGRYCYSIESI